MSIFDENMRARIERLAHPDEEMHSLIEAVNREIEIQSAALRPGEHPV